PMRLQGERVVASDVPHRADARIETRSVHGFESATVRCRGRTCRTEVSAPMADAKPRCDGEPVERDVILRKHGFATGVAIEMDVATPIAGCRLPCGRVRGIEAGAPERIRPPGDTTVARPIVAPPAARAFGADHE